MVDVLPNVVGESGPIEAIPVVIVDGSGAFSPVTVLGKQSFTRPDDTTAYAAADLIANSATAGSVDGLAFAGAGATGTITGVVVGKGGSAVAQIRVHFLKTDHAVTNGDNGGLVFTSLDLDNYIGSIDVNLADLANGGAMGEGYAAIDYATVEGTFYCFLEALAAFTPTALSVYTVAPRVRKYS